VTIRTLADLIATGGRVEIECLACGDIERRPAELIEAARSLSVGEVGLALSCRACGARACITSVAPDDDEQ
jgi:hypothetical protein